MIYDIVSNQLAFFLVPPQVWVPASKIELMILNARNNYRKYVVRHESTKIYNEDAHTRAVKSTITDVT